MNQYLISKDVLLILIKLGYTFQKEKELKRGFSLFNSLFNLLKGFKVFY
jgi:hypothetical protein